MKNVNIYTGVPREIPLKLYKYIHINHVLKASILCGGLAPNLLKAPLVGSLPHLNLMVVQTLVKNNNGKDTAIISFIKLFVILQYSSDDVPFK